MSTSHFSVPATVCLVAERPQRVVASDAIVARSFAARIRGLLGRRTLPDGEAMIFPQCRSIHTVGMRFAIDAVFVDQAWRVVALRENLRPGRLVFPVWGASSVIELAQGTIGRAELKIGDQLRVNGS